MMVVPWVLLLVVIVVAAGMICWIKSTKKGIVGNSFKMWSHSNTQSTVERRDPKEENKVEEKGDMYDEVKPNCAETAISLKSNIAYTTVKHTSVL